MPGYLSLHLTPPESLVIKWTPNHLMNGGPSTESLNGHPQDKRFVLTFIITLQFTIPYRDKEPFFDIVALVIALKLFTI